MKTIDRFSADNYIGKENSVFVKKTCLTEDFPLHWHNYFEIEMVTAGQGTMTINGEPYDASEQTVFLMTPVDFHQIHPDPRLQLLNISFDARHLSERTVLQLSCIKRNAYTLTKDAKNRLFLAIQLLQHECSIGGDCQGQLCEYILACLFREDSPIELPDNENLPGIQKAILYLEMHFKENISLSLLAQEAGFNPTYFSELFRKATGQSYKQRLTQLRVRYAKMLLKNGFPVSRACFDSGFGSLSNFTAVFKEAYGMTPRQYQLSH